MTPDNIVVLNDDNEQIPSQVLFRGGTEPQALIFQTDADPMESKRFKLVAGQRENYPAEAFGRTVPERYDDYAWENNKVAYRLYGPALETSPEKLVTPGIDVWVKCTDKLVIDEWYARGNYHHNYGDGMDCYKVGVTLGSGASLPFAGGKFWMMGHNYATARTLDNGPIRTSVELTYAPFDVDGTPVTLTKIISLDANQRFNRMDNIYEGAFAEMPIAAGFVRHDVKQMQRGEGWMALCEAVSDSKNPARDGDIYLGVILPGAEMLTDTLGHAVAVKAVKPGRTLTYYAGSGWSQGGVEDMKEWIEEIGQAQAAAVTPLKVTILRGYQRILRNIDAAHLGKFTRQFVHDAAAVHIFVSASAAQNQAAAVLYILFQHCFSLIGDQHRMRVEQYGIRFQIFCGYIVAQIDIIHRCVSSLCSFENTKLALPLYLFMPYIKLAVPYVVVIFQETNFCLVFGTCDLRQFLEFLVNRFYFCQSAIVSSGIIQDTVPVDFCSIGTRSPTEIADIISTVCNALHGPQCHLSRFRCWSCHTGIPSIGTGLLFHDTEVFGYGTNLRQVTAPHTVFQEVVRFVCIQAVSEVRVGIIHDEIQTLVCHSLVVQVAEQTVGGDKITRFQIFAVMSITTV